VGLGDVVDFSIINQQGRDIHLFMNGIIRGFIIATIVLLHNSSVLATDAVESMPPRFIADITIEGKSNPSEILWGDTVNGMAVGISSVTTSLLSPIWPTVYAYLENRGNNAISWAIQSRSMFVLELDGQRYSESNLGGKGSTFKIGDRLGPIPVDTVWFHKIEKAAPYQVIYDSASAPILLAGKHSLRIFYQSDQQLIPSSLLSISVKLRTYPMQEGVKEIAQGLTDRKSYRGRYQIADLAARMRMSGARSAVAAMLKDSDAKMRQAAARALGDIGDASVIPDLKLLALNDEWGVRNTAIESLVKLGEPFKSAWVEPIIKSKDLAVFQNAIWLERKYGGKKAAPTLIRCLDMNDPSVKSYYNYTLVWQIGACGGPQLKYHHASDGKGTTEQVEENRKTLAKMKNWHKYIWW